MSATTFRPIDFVLQGDDDHLRVDGLCRDLLLTFYHDLVASGIPADQATPLASSADYFVRDFVVDNRLTTPFAITPELIRQFAATWYIITTVEPTRDEVAGHLAGILAFCRYLVEDGYLPRNLLDEVAAECARVDYFANRIISFWQLDKDGFRDWEAECTLK
jgi:hypothetical protein